MSTVTERERFSIVYFFGESFVNSMETRRNRRSRELIKFSRAALKDLNVTLLGKCEMPCFKLDTEITKMMDYFCKPCSPYRRFQLYLGRRK